MASEKSKLATALHTFDIDVYLNRFIPRPRFYLLPRPISHFFGYRPPPKDAATAKPAAPVSNLLVWVFAFIGAFCGIAIIENVFLALPLLDGHQVPIVIASFGAAAILEYNAIDSPLSQPRNLILGHFLSATLGVCVTKLFLYLPPERFQDLRWLAGAISVGLASTVMGITKTVHPPAGATALLAATNTEITLLGWWLLPLVLLGVSLMLASAMIINNIYKRFPLFWWTPVDLKALHMPKEEIVKIKDIEKADTNSSIDSNSEAGLAHNKLDGNARTDSDATRAESYDNENPSIKKLSTATDTNFEEIRIEGNRILVPDWMELSAFESETLEMFQDRLRKGRKTDFYTSVTLS